MAAVAEEVTTVVVVVAERTVTAVEGDRTAVVIPTDVDSQCDFKARSDSGAGLFIFALC
jgi:hypothetical protein